MQAPGNVTLRHSVRGGDFRDVVVNLANFTSYEALNASICRRVYGVLIPAVAVRGSGYVRTITDPDVIDGWEQDEYLDHPFPVHDDVSQSSEELQAMSDLSDASVDEPADYLNYVDALHVYYVTGGGVHRGWGRMRFSTFVASGVERIVAQPIALHRLHN